MKTKSKAKWVKISPRKVQRVINQIRGKSAEQALVMLKFMPLKAARLVEKVLGSALANAVNNNQQGRHELYISEICADSAAIMKRWQPHAKGRAFPIKKRLSHITVTVAPKAPPEKQAQDKEEK